MPDDVSLAEFARPGRPDYVDAFQAALDHLSERGGGVLRVPAGTFPLSSAALGRGIATGSGVTIRGAGPDRTRLRVTGNATNHTIFTLNGQRDVTIADMTLRGHGIATIDNDGAAIHAYMTAETAQNMGSFRVERVRFENFKANYWCAFAINRLPMPPRRYEKIVVDDCVFVSEPGNAIRPELITWPAHAIQVEAQEGQITRFESSRCRFEARHMKGAYFILHRVTDARIVDAVINDAGTMGAGDDAAAYGIALYDSTSLGLARVTIVRPIIRNPRSCGIYLAAGSDIIIDGAQISGQTDRAGGTLPKGAIAINATRNVRITGSSRFADNHWDISITVAPVSDAQILIDGAKSTNAQTSILLSYTPFRRIVGGVTIRNIRATSVRPGSHGIDIFATGVFRIDNILISGCAISARDYGLDLYALSEASASDNIVIRNSSFAANSGPIRLRGARGRVTVQDVTIRAGINAVGLEATNAPRLSLSNVSVTGGAVAFDLRGAGGTARDLSFAGSRQATPPGRALGSDVIRRRPTS